MTLNAFINDVINLIRVSIAEDPEIQALIHKLTVRDKDLGAWVSQPSPLDSGVSTHAALIHLPPLDHTSLLLSLPSPKGKDITHGQDAAECNHVDAPWDAKDTVFQDLSPLLTCLTLHKEWHIPSCSSGQICPGSKDIAIIQKANSKGYHDQGVLIMWTILIVALSEKDSPICAHFAKNQGLGLDWTKKNGSKDTCYGPYDAVALLLGHGVEEKMFKPQKPLDSSPSRNLCLASIEL
ncbi:hypothetical protein BS47DRAFT_1363927 [Hydnum rufescens UP504]|uniref:Uncharacterized protein n=1 Tax=Hydnum rufescens UP504 TaxID=1448309 RepID=A0A9P6DU55_9AGAM|nr:hypothetical protein BS47DRAFT_1363927 [Hydnum rufescens UP504]